MIRLTCLLSSALLLLLGFCAGQAIAQSAAAPRSTRPGTATAPGTTAAGGASATSDKTQEPPAEPEKPGVPTDLDRPANIDWGDGEKIPERPDDPEMRQPSREVDLATALDESQRRRLEVIWKKAAEVDVLADLAQKTQAGETKGMTKDRCIGQYAAASSRYRGVYGDLQRLARSIRDEDTKLALLRKYGDVYRQKAIRMMLNAGNVTMEMQKNAAGLRSALEYYKQAKAIDEYDPGWRQGVQAVQVAAQQMAEQVAQARAAALAAEEAEKRAKRDRMMPDRTVGDWSDPNYGSGRNTGEVMILP